MGQEVEEFQEQVPFVTSVLVTGLTGTPNASWPIPLTSPNHLEGGLEFLTFFCRF